MALSTPMYAVVVLGSGPAACATALSLSARGVQPLLLVGGQPVSLDRMSESIPPDTGGLLKRLGLCDDFLRSEHQPYFGAASSWGNSELQFNDFIFNPYGNGWHVDRNRFDQYLLQQALDRGTEVQIGSRIVKCETRSNDDSLIHVVSNSGTRNVIRTRFVVDATGLKGAFVRRIGIKRLYFDSLICLSCVFEMKDRIQIPKHSLVVAEECGWWYAAAAPRGSTVVALVSDPNTVRSERLRLKNIWLSKLNGNQHLTKYLHSVYSRDRPLQFRPAPSFLSDRVHGPSWLSVGDAASAFDPLSSQGVYKALSDGLAAGEAIAEYRRGNLAALGDYECVLIKRFRAYVEVRRSFYAKEGRWAESSFWKARQKHFSSFSN